MIIKKKVPFFKCLERLGRFYPEVKAPEYRYPLRDRLLWTCGILFIYKLCCQIKTYGTLTTIAVDPLYWVRQIIASDLGSLMEMGVAPMITADMTMHILSACDVLSYDTNSQEDKQQWKTLKKALTVMFIVGGAIFYTLSGVYTVSTEFHVWHFILIALQLCIACNLLVLLDDILSKGYGLGDGNYQLFIASNICEKIIWGMLSPKTIEDDNGVKKEGVVISLFHMLFTRSNKIYAIAEAVWRTSAPNLFTFLIVVTVFLTFIYTQGYRVNLFVKNQRVRGQQNSYPIRLFYTSNLPIILYTAVIYNLYLISQVLYTQLSKNTVIKLLGQWSTPRYGGAKIPTGGLIYYISPPSSVLSLVAEPVHTVVYILSVLSIYLIFSHTWLYNSGNSAKHVAKSLREQGMVVRGHRDTSIVFVLNRYIPTASMFGGMAFGLLTIAGDVLGAMGSGTGALIAGSILYQYYEILSRERDYCYLSNG